VSLFSTPVDFNTAPNQPISIQFSWVVDFCPEQVSLHFEAQNGAYDVAGVFTHECLPVPETSTVAPSLALAAGVAGWAWAWRRRRTTV
jgi:MYXO-CTERM domain-containing protein